MSANDFSVMRYAPLGLTVVGARTRRTLGRHSHDQYGLGLMVRGAHRSASGRGEVEAVAGQVITVNPGEVHDGRPMGDAGRVWRMIYLDPARVVELVGGGAGGYEFEHPAGDDAETATGLRRMFDLLDGRPQAGLAIESLLVEGLAALGVRRPEAGRGYPAAVRRAISLIDDDSVRPLSLAELAAAAGLGRFQFLRAFRRATGLTPHAYLVQRRTDRARGLVIAGSGLAEAAIDAGFADQSHMTRAFAARYGFTPGRLAGACNFIQDGGHGPRR